MIELYKRYRPKSLKTVFGQEGAIASLQKKIEEGKIPHSILLTGPSGCGKTTIARILKKHLQCHDNDFVEINAADSKGIDMVREVKRASNLAPLHGPVRIWLLDEAHKLTSEAQAALLKILEDNPKSTYFILATTDAHKLARTIITRCTEVKLVALSPDSLTRVVKRVVDKENMQVSETVVEEIVSAADGSARKALVILEQVGSLETEEAQIAAIQTTAANKELAITLARALFNPRVQWGEVAGILKQINDDPEGIRYLVLGYARSILLGGGRLAPRAFMMIEIFGRNFYDSKQAGLAAACWEAVTSK